MRRMLVATLLLAATGGPALAQGRPAIDLSLCQPLARHRPAPDVDYRPGIDARGRRVAPADLPGSPGAAAPIDRFEIAVTLDMARRMGLHPPTGGLRGGTGVGWLTMEGGRLFFNGLPLDTEAESRVLAYCRAP